MNGVSNFDVFIINILPFLPLHGEKKIDLKTNIIKYHNWCCIVLVRKG